MGDNYSFKVHFRNLQFQFPVADYQNIIFYCLSESI